MKVLKHKIPYPSSDEELRLQTKEWAARIGVKLKEIHIREMRTKWASISSSRRITLSTELLELPKHLIDYVIVHELVHLLAPNHGKVFKSFMLAYLPDWEIRDQEIRELNSLM